MTSNRIVYATSTTSAARKAEREQRQAEAATRREQTLSAFHQIAGAPFDEGRDTVAFLTRFPEDVTR